MQTGLENMRDKIMQDTEHWKQIAWVEDFVGDGESIWYCEHQDLTCYMDYTKDMDGELYLEKITFLDGKQFVEEKEEK